MRPSVRASFKPREGKERSFNRFVKKEFYEDQIHKLPNEFRHAFTNYNHLMPDGIAMIDENDYEIK